MACQVMTGVPVVFDQRDEVGDRLQAGAFRAVAPAAQVLGPVAGMLVVEGVGSPRASAGLVGVASWAEGRSSRDSSRRCPVERLDQFFSHNQVVGEHL